MIEVAPILLYIVIMVTIFRAATVVYGIKDYRAHCRHRMGLK